MKKGRFTTRQLALNAMLMAMCTVLASVALKLGGNFKLTFESVPIHIGALLFGPVDGMLIGGLGTFIYQALFSGYGINATTLLWILPYVVCGLSVGAYARRRHFVLNRRQTTFIMLVSELAITLLNTFALLCGQPHIRLLLRCLCLRHPGRPPGAVRGQGHRLRQHNAVADKAAQADGGARGSGGKREGPAPERTGTGS